MKFAVLALLGAVSAATPFTNIVDLAKYKVKKSYECNEGMSVLYENMANEMFALFPKLETDINVAMTVKELGEFF